MVMYIDHIYIHIYDLAEAVVVEAGVLRVAQAVLRVNAGRLLVLVAPALVLSTANRERSIRILLQTESGP